MLKYLVIILSNRSTSYCHYDVPDNIAEKTISTDDLKEAILFGMKENLTIQFVFPEYEMPDEHLRLIDSIDHIQIKPIRRASGNDIGIVNNWSQLSDSNECGTIVIRTSINDLTQNHDLLLNALTRHERTNIVLTDINVASQSLISNYKSWLIEFANNGFKELCMESDRIPQLNIISDRLTLNSMNNCNAGVDTLTVGPDGKFYICPGFYYDGSESVGNPADCLKIKNCELLKLDHAPICKICDAWQCKRCVWSNLHRTHEINTPGRGQCLISHCEREASRQLLSSLKDNGIEIPNTQIERIDYNEPFETLTR